MQDTHEHVSYTSRTHSRTHLPVSLLIAFLDCRFIYKIGHCDGQQGAPQGTVKVAGATLRTLTRRVHDSTEEGLNKCAAV